jgi:hypothetical protein
MNRTELEALQLRKLQSQLIRVHETSPYYREKFRRAGVDRAGRTRLGFTVVNSSRLETPAPFLAQAPQLIRVNPARPWSSP